MLRAYDGQDKGVIDMTDTVKYFPNGMEGRPFETNPRLTRTGIVSNDYGEMTPVVFGEKLLLLATAKATAEVNPYDTGCLWVEDVATHRVVATFAEACAFGSGFVHEDIFYAFAVPRDTSGVQRIDGFWSKDLASWESGNALLPDGSTGVIQSRLYKESSNVKVMTNFKGGVRILKSASAVKGGSGKNEGVHPDHHRRDATD